MDSLNNLSELFARFPGVGPRQARRFVYYLLRQSPGFARELSDAIRAVKKNVRLCEESFAYFYSEDPRERLHPIARDERRDDAQLLVIEKDSDLESIEKSGIYRGRYFVLGGTVPILDEHPEKKVRMRELKRIVEKRLASSTKAHGSPFEVILALSATPEGEHTAEYVAGILKRSFPRGRLKVSLLGRGLSTGSELEYADKETLKNALENRR